MEKAALVKLRAAERQIAIARAIIIVFGSLTFFLLEEEHLNKELALWLLAPIYAYGAIWLWLRPYEKFPVLVSSWFSFISDSLFATLWIYATGGFYSPYHMLYYTSIAAVAYRYGIRTTFFAASLYALLYLTLLTLLGQLWGHEGRILVRIGFIYILGYMTWLITRETLLQTQQKLQLRSLMHEAEQSQRKLLQLNRRLHVQNEIFNHAEESALIGSYQWDLSSQEITFSDNLYRLLGHEPGDFHPSVKKYEEFLHPDEHVSFTELASQAGNGERSDFVHKIVRRDGELRHMRATARLHQGPEGHQLIIGTLQDVTEDVMLNEQLREKNAELENFNHELGSFNYIASHDLQEPLRKILTFTDLVKEKETSISDSSKSFLERTSAAARRMQMLIQAFLAYSQIGSSKPDFEDTDLTEVVHEVEQLLEEQISESGASVEMTELPVIRGMSIQLQQLFVNLISNSLKYAKSGVPPRITITAEEVSGVQAENMQTQGRNRYWKISVHDNGIGFPPEYNEKVFEVFHRLHAKEKYEGTGIGLAICKKVVTAHKGYIRAEGFPGKGASFHIYFPVHP